MSNETKYNTRWEQQGQLSAAPNFLLYTDTIGTVP